MPIVPVSPIPQEPLGWVNPAGSTPTSDAVHPKLWSKLKDERKEVIRLNRKGCHRQAELDRETETAGKPTAPGWQEAGGWRPGGAEGRYPPLLAVLPHAHPAPVPRGGVAAGPLPHLEADPTRGAAGRPRGPGGPASVPRGRSNRVTGVNLCKAQPLSACTPKFTRGFPPRGPLTTDHGCEGHGSKEPQESMQCTVSGINAMYCLVTAVIMKSVPAPEPDFRVKKENLRVKFYVYLQIT